MKYSVLSFLLIFNATAGISQSPGIQVSVHRNIELGCIVQLLAEKMYYTGSDYQQQTISSFAPYKTHKAVKMLSQYVPNGGYWNLPGTIGLHLANNTKRELILPFSEADYKGVFPTEAILKEYLDALRDFAKISGFDKFYNKQLPFYNQVIARLQHQLDSAGIDLAASLHRYYQEEVSSRQQFIVHLSLMGPGGGYAPLAHTQVTNKPFVVHPGGYQHGIFNFPIPYLVPLLFHEFSHGIVNPLTETHSGLFEPSSILLKPIQKTVAWADGIKEWQGCVNEHIIRAITAHFIGTAFGETAMKNELDRQQNVLGFRYIKVLFDLMNNSHTPLPGQWIQAMAASLDSIKKSWTLFTPPNWTALNNREYPFYVFVYPTGEEDKPWKETIISSIEMLRKRGSVFTSFIIPDTQAIAMDARYTFVCYGSITGNKMIEKYASQLPFSLTKDSISIADTTIKGNDWWMSASMPNPDNPQVALFFNTAASAANINHTIAPIYWRESLVLGKASNFNNSFDLPVLLRMNAQYELYLQKKE